LQLHFLAYVITKFFLLKLCLDKHKIACFFDYSTSKVLQSFILQRLENPQMQNSPMAMQEFGLLGALLFFIKVF